MQVLSTCLVLWLISRFNLHWGLVAAGINAGMILASSALETTIDLVSNILGGSPSSLGSILTDHINSLLYAESGVWSNFVYNAATDWGGVVDALQS
ncbi:Uncharacterised protein (plasmid) [Klebsiella aerogenes]|nr:Uncharacterised protein [Klebsiella aerogenes]